MPRRLAYLLAWGVATTLTVGASWLGIASVLSTAAPARTSPLSAADLHDAAPSRSPAVIPAPTTPIPLPAPTTPARTSRPAAPSITPSPTSTGWQAEPDGRGGTAYRRIFRMAGGEATIWFARGEIRVLSAVAKPGFAVDVDRPALDSTTVTFYSSRSRSRVWAAWRSGPYVEVSEGR